MSSAMSTEHALAQEVATAAATSSGNDSAPSRADQTDSAIADEELDGFVDRDATWNDYPLDVLLIRHESRTVYDIVRRIKNGQYVLDPEFQRAFIWSEDKQSKLIESVILRIPLPVVYLAEANDGKMIVVDGLQRLSTFSRFLNDELKLCDLDIDDLNGKRFSDLTSKLQNRIEDCNLIVYAIDSRVPDRAKLDIFDRVNSGVPLSRQQMRNCLFMGKGTRFLRDQVASGLFLKATGNSLNSKTMRDREFVNRFCAFRILGPEEYRGNMDGFLAEALKRMNAMDDGQLSSLAQDFQRGLANNLTVFGRHAFRKYSVGQERRSVLNASLWDVMSTGLAQYPEHIVADEKTGLCDAIEALLQDDDFVASITYSTNDTKRVMHRFARCHAMLGATLR